MHALVVEEGAQAYTLNTLALSYQFAGQTGQALPLSRRANEIFVEMQVPSYRHPGLSNLYVALILSEALRQAAGTLRQALVLNQELDDRFQKGVSLKQLGCVLATTGDAAPSRVAPGRSRHMAATRRADQG